MTMCCWSSFSSLLSHFSPRFRYHINVADKCVAYNASLVKWTQIISAYRTKLWHRADMHLFFLSVISLLLQVYLVLRTIVCPTAYEMAVSHSMTVMRCEWHVAQSRQGSIRGVYLFFAHLPIYVNEKKRRFSPQTHTRTYENSHGYNSFWLWILSNVNPFRLLSKLNGISARIDTRKTNQINAWHICNVCNVYFMNNLFFCSAIFRSSFRQNCQETFGCCFCYHTT